MPNNKKNKSDSMIKSMLLSLPGPYRIFKTLLKYPHLLLLAAGAMTKTNAASVKNDNSGLGLFFERENTSHPYYTNATDAELLESLHFRAMLSDPYICHQVSRIEERAKEQGKNLNLFDIQGKKPSNLVEDCDNYLTDLKRIFEPNESPIPTEQSMPQNGQSMSQDDLREHLDFTLEDLKHFSEEFCKQDGLTPKSFPSCGEVQAECLCELPVQAPENLEKSNLTTLQAPLKNDATSDQPVSLLPLIGVPMVTVAAIMGFFAGRKYQKSQIELKNSQSNLEELSLRASNSSTTLL